MSYLATFKIYRTTEYSTLFGRYFIYRRMLSGEVQAINFARKSAETRATVELDCDNRIVSEVAICEQ